MASGAAHASGTMARRLPADHHGGTGMRMIEGLARQLSAEVAWDGTGGGTRLTLTIRRRQGAPEPSSGRPSGYFTST